MPGGLQRGRIGLDAHRRRELGRSTPQERGKVAHANGKGARFRAGGLVLEAAEESRARRDRMQAAIATQRERRGIGAEERDPAKEEKNIAEALLSRDLDGFARLDRGTERITQTGIGRVAVAPSVFLPTAFEIAQREPREREPEMRVGQPARRDAALEDRLRFVETPALALDVAEILEREGIRRIDSERLAIRLLGAIAIAFATLHAAEPRPRVRIGGLERDRSFEALARPRVVAAIGEASAVLVQRERPVRARAK